MGARIEERADGFVIAGPTPLHGARVSAHKDHRLAMSLAVAGLIARGETTIEGWECVADSFPNFGDLLLQVPGAGRNDLGSSRVRIHASRFTFHRRESRCYVF